MLIYIYIYFFYSSQPFCIKVNGAQRVRMKKKERERELQFGRDWSSRSVKTFVTDCVRLLVTRRTRRRPMRLHVTKDTGADTRNRTLAPNRGRRYVASLMPVLRDKRVISDYPQHLATLCLLRAQNCSPISIPLIAFSSGFQVVDNVEGRG